jgi:hypothetical protein
MKPVRFIPRLLALTLLPLAGIAAIHNVSTAQVTPAPIAPGALPNIGLLTVPTPLSTPTCNGIVRSANPTNVQSVINQAVGGDLVLLDSGTYSGLALTVANQATEACEGPVAGGWADPD